jgi:hypothetical protein
LVYKDKFCCSACGNVTTFGFYPTHSSCAKKCKNSNLENEYDKFTTFKVSFGAIIPYLFVESKGN